MSPTPGDDGSLVILANFASVVAVDLQEHDVVRLWARQAPREIWLARPGGVLLAPVPLATAFVRYACSLLGVPHDSIHVLVIPDAPYGSRRHA